MQTDFSFERITLASGDGEGKRQWGNGPVGRL